jgi:hypothetical protein
VTIGEPILRRGYAGQVATTKTTGPTGPIVTGPRPGLIVTGLRPGLIVTGLRPEGAPEALRSTRT